MAPKSRNAAPLSPMPDGVRDETPGARRLDFDALNGHLGYFLRRLQVLVFQDFIQALATFDVRPAQYSVMVLVASNPGQSQSTIAKALNIERAALAKMLHELQARGWIQRLPSVSDGRSHALFMTRDGARAFARIKALALAHERRLERAVGTRRHRELMSLLKDFG